MKDTVVTLLVLDIQIRVGRVLGRGGFCVVCEVSGFDLDLENESEGDEHEGYNARRDLADRCLRNGEARYAIKRLQEDVRKDDHTFRSGIVDLAMEAKFLTVLEHPHVIKMRAVRPGPQSNADYFIILDRLYDTMEHRLGKWRKEHKKVSGVLSKIRSKGRREEFISGKLIVAYDLASALCYLHDNRIIYRDMKPDNIGFDVRDEPKIFDLGLARELPSGEEREYYKMTGWTGSLKYMAPEVALEKDYNLRADVYSFGIIFWQICSYDEPFKNYKMKMLEEYVVAKGYRPKINPNWPKSWGELLRKCWHADPAQRPDTEEVMMDLREMICDLQGDDTELDVDASMRSRGNMHPKRR